MKTLCITGGRPLSGEIRISGSKNAALPILFATLLIREPVLLENIPDIRDTALAIDLLSGFSVKTCAHGGGTYAIDAKRAAPGAGELSPARSMRGSIYLLGASLARFGKSPAVIAC
jgi:UDP-N-acetylglucosamine 1-carboxyvinyltransferase